jgi:ABC-type multidrug transport system ATPase subunit
MVVAQCLFYKYHNRSILSNKLCNDYIELVGLHGKADRPVREFSGGELHLKILESFRGRSTIFYSTHILDDVQRVSDRVVIMEQGKLIAQSLIKELLAGDRSLFYATVRGMVWLYKMLSARYIPDLGGGYFVGTGLDHGRKTG